MAFRRVDENRTKTDDIITRNQSASSFVVKAEVPARMSGRVQSAQLDLRIAVQFEHIPVFNKTIDANLTFQATDCLPMRRYRNSSAVFRSQLII